MKKGKLFLCLFMVAVLSGVWLSPGPASAQTIELSLSLMIPPKHLRNINVFEPWIKMVEERTQGKVKIKPFFSSTLAQPQETFDGVASGVADMGESYTFGNPGRFALSETLMLPEMGFPTALGCGKALWHLYKTFPEVQAEYKGVKMLWLHATPGAKLNTKKKAVKNLEDLKGMKIAVSGSTMVKVGRALGLTPVTMSTNDLYEAGDKGVIDGFVRPVELLVSRKLAEVAKYVTEVDLGHDLFFVVMNQKKWDSLPPDVQKVLTELSGDWAVDFTGKAWDKFDKEAETEVKAKGIEFISLPAQEEAKWKKVMAPIGEEYASDLEAKKLPGKKIFGELKKLAEKKN
jgi:TRAP-type transport system periplasmic protein